VSVEKRQRQKGYVYIVWWKDASRNSHNKTFNLKRDADAFDAKIKLAKRSGDLEELDIGKETFTQFEKEWWTLYAQRHLAEKTRKQYRYLLDRYVLPTFRDEQIRRMTTVAILEWSEGLLGVGVGDETVRKTLGMVQGIMQRAVEWGRLRVNPVRSVKKPSGARKRTIRALSPSQVEGLRASVPTLADKTLISVLAYGGLRPGEALALTWGDVTKRTIRIDKAVSLGETKDTKTEKHRTVPMLRHLAQDLNELRMASGRPADSALVFPRTQGGLWREHTYRNWRRRVYKPAAEAIGLSKTSRPYDLRHSRAALLYAEGVNPAEIAKIMGHSVETLSSSYTHVISELAGAGPQNPTALIKRARAAGHILVTQESAAESQA
jgi:integrase